MEGGELFERIQDRDGAFTERGKQIYILSVIEKKIPLCVQRCQNKVKQEPISLSISVISTPSDVSDSLSQLKIDQNMFFYLLGYFYDIVQCWK